MHRNNSYEQLACDFVRHKGLSIIERNFTWKGGEIDIIAFDQTELIFFEVKYRSDSDFGTPLERITPQQIRRIHNTAQIFLDAHDEYDQYFYRFDALALTPVSKTLDQTYNTMGLELFNNMMMEWIPDAF